MDIVQNINLYIIACDFVEIEPSGKTVYPTLTFVAFLASSLSANREIVHKAIKDEIRDVGVVIVEVLTELAIVRFYTINLIIIILRFINPFYVFII